MNICHIISYTSPSGHQIGIKLDSEKEWFKVIRALYKVLREAKVKCTLEQEII